MTVACRGALGVGADELNRCDAEGFCVTPSQPGGIVRVVGPVDLAGLVDCVQQLPQPLDARSDARITLVP
jgi:hypothetical protein